MYTHTHTYTYTYTHTQSGNQLGSVVGKRDVAFLPTALEVMSALPSLPLLCNHCFDSQATTKERSVEISKAVICHRGMDYPENSAG